MISIHQSPGSAMMLGFSGHLFEASFHIRLLNLSMYVILDWHNIHLLYTTFHVIYFFFLFFFFFFSIYAIKYESMYNILAQYTFTIHQFSFNLRFLFFIFFFIYFFFLFIHFFFFFFFFFFFNIRYFEI